MKELTSKYDIVSLNEQDGLAKRVDKMFQPLKMNDVAETIRKLQLTLQIERQFSESPKFDKNFSYCLCEQKNIFRFMKP